MTKEKDRSNNPASQFRDDFTLPRVKILRGRKNFNRLFEGDPHILRDRYVGLRFKIVDETAFGCLMGFIVRKGLGKAHQRNRMKRLLREAYRLHQHMLSDPLKDTNRTFHGAFMARTVDADFRQVEQNVAALLGRAIKQFPTSSAQS